MVRAGRGHAAVLLGEVGGLGGEELGSQIARAVVGSASLARLAELELSVGGEKSLVVCWTAQGLLSTSLVFDGLVT